MNQRLRNLGGCFVVLGFYALATLPILLTFPPAWPDEAIFYSPAAALARGQGMGTAELAGFLPGIGRYTYWQPPGYIFFLSLVLRFVAPVHHFVAMRLFSWFFGAVVLLLGVVILKQLAHKWIWALPGLVVLGTEVGFMQAANVGRMEMMSLAFTLAALIGYLAYRKKGQRKLLALASLFAGLALISHPAGILAGFVMVVHEVAAPTSRGHWLKDAAVFAACAAAPFVPWLVYIMRAPNFFLAQMAAQSVRKALKLGFLLTTFGYKYWLMFPFGNAACPVGDRWYGFWPFHMGSSALVPFLVFCAGLAGLLAMGRHRVEASVLGVWALAGYGLNLLMPEFWYTVYFLTPSCLLVGWALVESSRRWMRAIALATLIVAAAWNSAEANLIWWNTRDGWLAYRSYCSTLAQMIPAHSTILLAVIPDPFFGLLNNSNSYRLYEFVPVDVPVDKEQAEQVLESIDYVVGSDCCRPDYLVDYLTAHGKLAALLGRRDFRSPPVKLWKLHERPNLPIPQGGNQGNVKQNNFNGSPKVAQGN